MENELRDSKLLDFIETVDFDALETADKYWVLEHLTEEEYRFRREIILASQEMTPIGLVAPLQVKKKTRVLPFVLTAVTSAAAAVIVAMLLFSPEPVNHVHISWGDSNVRKDTVVVEQIKLDTIIEFIYVPVKNDVRALTAERADPLPEFSAKEGPDVHIRSVDLVNSGTNFSEDANAEPFRPARFVGL